ncbi:MAG: succinate dehydrogenase assembly factor 4 [Steroidobacteraceae bacterium]
MLMQSLAESTGAVDSPTPAPASESASPVPLPEVGGPAGPEPTRYGDWERRGRCIDF